MKKKVILNANNSFVIYNFRYGLMKALEEEYEVITVSGKDSSANLIKKNGWKFIEVGIDRRGKNIINDVKLFIQYIRIYAKEKPEYILNYTIKPNIYSTLAAKILGIKTINNITGLGDTFNKNNITNKIIKLLYKISFRYPKKIFFQNDDDMNIFLEQKLVKKEKCGRIPGSGVNIEKFFPMEKSGCDDKIKLLFIGRISENKGVKIIYEVAKKLKTEFPKLEFQLLGKIYMDEDSHISEEELKIWEKECNLIYLGTSKDVRNQIKESDAIIFPSYYREGVPRSLIEAAAMGKPILTTNNVGCKDIVKDGYNGFLSEPQSVESMINIVKKFLFLEKSEQERLGINGRKKVENEFDERIVIAQYLSNMK